MYFKSLLQFILLFLDIDECLAEVCDSNAECTNSEGSYSCSCVSGYRGDGTPSNCSGDSTFSTITISTCYKFLSQLQRQQFGKAYVYLESINF